MPRQLWQFHGGLRLDGHKAMSMTEPTAKAAIPPLLTLPLQQHIGEPAEPVVKTGDRVLKGQMLAHALGYVSAPVHAPTSGTVVAIEDRPVPHPSGLSAPCIIIEADGEDRAIEFQRRDYTDMDPSALRNLLRDAGIVGLGGAGFPSYIKLNPGPGHVVETLILNGAECEPYITCDAMLMQEQPRRIIDGLLIIRHALQAKHCIIAVEDNKPEAIRALGEALSGDEAEFIEIVEIPTIYPTGGEKQLIKVVSGQEVPSNGLPIDIGVVCHNVATAAAVARAIEGEPLIARYVTITGDAVSRPRNLEVRIGTPFKAVLEECGYDPQSEAEIIMGGPLMGFLVPDADVPIIKTSNCILTQAPQTSAHNKAAMPCIRCAECVKVCPVQLLPQQLYWHARAREFERTQEYNLFDCIECGCCAYVCPSHIPLVQYYRFAKTEIWALEREKQKADHARQRHEFRVYRLERKKQEDEERKRKKKELLKKASAAKAEGETDSKKAAIEAAMARVKAKRAQQEQQKKNVDNLSEAQQKAIAAVEERRQQQHDTETTADTNNNEQDKQETS